MSDEYRRWEARFASPDYVFGRAPNEFLASCKPLLPKSGRALSIAVRSNDAKRIVVASESGGLFQTFDGGKYWLHLDAFPNYKPIDVASA